MIDHLLLSRLRGYAKPLLPFALIAIVWFGVTQAALYPPELLVSPQQVVRAFLELIASDELQTHLQASLQRLAAGVALGSLLGLVFGVLMAVFRPLELFAGPTFHMVRQVPSVALIPILILIFGIGETFKILIIIKASFFPLALAASESIKGVSAQYVDVARAYQLRRRTLFLRILVPATTPDLITGFRLAMGRSWGTLVAAELLAAESGLGQMMEFGRQMFRMDVVMVGMVITGLIGFGLDRLIKQAERRCLRWRAA